MFAQLKNGFGPRTAGFQSVGPSLWSGSEQRFRAICATKENEVSVLDTIVAHANGLKLFGQDYKPYWIMSDIAVVAAVAYAWAFSARFSEVSGFGLVVALIVALMVYKLVLEIKAALGKTAARSFLQDCLLVIIPTYLAVSLLFRQPLSLTFAFLGTLLPLYGGLARIGCFLGGCCYGNPSTSGVLYPRSIFESACQGKRRFSPSPNPGVRVFPIQLVEAGFQGTIFVMLVTLLWHAPQMAGAIFWMNLSLYALIRFVLDFYRTTSARPRYWLFSEAQWVCIAVQLVSVTVLVHTWSALARFAD